MLANQPSLISYQPFSDYHTHPQGHRVQPYTVQLLQPWVDSARARGLTAIAFTDHDRYCEGVDFDVTNRVRDANPDVEIRLGIELDNDPIHSAAGHRWVEANWDKIDFVLGSVHFLEDPERMFDTVPEGAAQFVGQEIDEVYANYFRRVREMAASGLVDCLAHIDLVKIHGHRSVSDVRQLAEATLQLIAARGLSIELSTAGWRKPVKELYPADSLIELARSKGIAFTTASDAHSHVQLGENFPSLAEKMSTHQIGEVAVYAKHKRSMVVLGQ